MADVFVPEHQAGQNITIYTAVSFRDMGPIPRGKRFPVAKASAWKSPTSLRAAASGLANGRSVTSFFAGSKPEAHA
ncbi:hypothetical protein [Bradyrhizobium cytisi]|uniref:hypothetical protein n=1 Tax=Bradyrhizobium cytisi TaxID=515489 RepID=UPI001652C86A|nr:hypothetical protein [Bradyrhizobium cytisi]